MLEWFVIGLGMVGGAIAGAGANTKGAVSKYNYVKYKANNAISPKKVFQYSQKASKVIKEGLISATRAAFVIGGSTALNRYLGGMSIWLLS